MALGDSEFNRQDLESLGFPRTAVLPVVPDLAHLDDPADWLVTQQFDDEWTNILFVGRFESRKGLLDLLKAYRILRKTGCPCRLLVVGGGPQEANLRKQAEALGLRDIVIFTGRVPHKDVNRYYDLIDVLAYPRHPMRLTELVTPLKPLEAMAQGQLFVASDVGGHKELVKHNQTGILFKAGSKNALADAIQNLLANRQRWPELKANGRRFVEDIRNWRNSVANYRTAYSKLIVQSAD